MRWGAIGALGFASDVNNAQYEVAAGIKGGFAAGLNHIRVTLEWCSGEELAGGVVVQLYEAVVAVVVQDDANTDGLERLRGGSQTSCKQRSAASLERRYARELTSSGQASALCPEASPLASGTSYAYASGALKVVVCKRASA